MKHDWNLKRIRQTVVRDLECFLMADVGNIQIVTTTLRHQHPSPIWGCVPICWSSMWFSINNKIMLITSPRHIKWLFVTLNRPSMTDRWTLTCKITGCYSIYIDVSDESRRRNVLVTFMSCWWRFCPCRQYPKTVTNINVTVTDRFGVTFLVSKAHKKKNPTRNEKIKHYESLNFHAEL